ncbi:MAG: nucleotidyltransferase family protein [Treponema sp.]|nr:nucleotidyltransferase family protein [Treponema sp.]
MRCCAIIMAAGLSKRFGNGNKLLMPFRGKPLACHALDLICSMDCFERIFFICADKNVAALADAAVSAGRPVTVVHNPSPEKGQGESALLGVRAADGLLDFAAEESYYLFLPGDQPLLDAATVSLLLDAARPGCIVQPGIHNSPSLFSVSFRDELLALKQEHPRLLKSLHPQAVITVEPPNPGVLADIDTQSDFERLSLHL